MGQKNTAVEARSGGRMEQLQFIRFVMFFFVFLVHGEFIRDFPWDFMPEGLAGVNFFFCVSGILTGWLGYGRDISLKPGALAGFVKGKLKKQYPLYALSILVGLLSYPIVESIVVGNAAALIPVLWHLIQQLLMIQPWFTEGYFEFNGALWFVPVLLFLGLWGQFLLALLNRTRKEKPWVAPGMLGAGAVYTAAYCFLTRGMDINYWHHVTPLCRLGQYALCVAVGFLYRERCLTRGEGEGKPLLDTLAEVGAVALWLVFTQLPAPAWANVTLQWIVPNVVLILVFMRGRGLLSRVLRWRPLVYLGDISFECYCIHAVVLQRYTLLHPTGGLSLVLGLGGMVFCLVLTLLTAAALRALGAKK